MKHIKNIIVKLIAVLIVLSQLLGLTATASAEEVELSFWNGFTASDGEILQGIVNEFNETNDKDITISMEVMSWANFNEKLPPSIVANSAPDFVLMNYSDFSSYVSNGTMQPMDDFFELEGVNKDDFVESSLELTQLDGTQYFIPMQIQGMYLYWNKDLFEAAGLDPNTPPATWDELVEYAIQLTDNSKNQFGFALPYDGYQPFSNWLLANGGSITNEDYTESTFASEGTLETLQEIQTLIAENEAGPKTISGAEADNLLNSGQLGMYINGPWLNNGLKANEINYGVTGVPQGDVDGDKQAILDGVGFGIPVSTSEDKKEAIYEFVKYWNTTEIGKKWSLENGFPPYLKSVAEDSEVSEDPIVSELYKQIEYATPFMPMSTSLPAINGDVIRPLIENIMAGNDIQTEMDNAHESIQMLLAN